MPTELAVDNKKKANHFSRKENNFMRMFCVWKNFCVRSGKMKIARPQDPDWWCPSRARGKKRWYQDQSKLAREWAEREYELDYHDVEFKKI